MTARVTGPDGQEWTVRRSLLKGPDGRGWRWRWRGPDPGWLEALRLADLADLADIPVIGVGILALIAIPIIAVVLVFLPFVALGLLEALVLGIVVAALVAMAVLFGRPVLVRAEREPDVMRVWAVVGWAESKRARDRIVAALRTGGDPDAAAGGPPIASHG